MSDFNTDRKLLNPKFEGYKLSALDQSDHVAGYALTAQPTQANVSGKTKSPLSFEEVQSRITHNHLSVSYDSRSAVYVDEHLNVVRVSIGADCTPSFNVICELPKHVQSAEVAETQHVEYPTAFCLSDGSWLVSDGSGLLYVLGDDDRTTRIISTFQLLGEDDRPFSRPFRLHTGHLRADGTTVCILSDRQLKDQVSSGTSGSETKKFTKPQFDIWCVEFSIGASSEDPLPFRVLWYGVGGDIPLSASFYEPQNAFFILGAPYKQVDAPEQSSYEPSKDESMSVRRKDDIPLDAPAKPPPYSWTQTSDSVTVAFPLPSNTPKNEIKITLTAKTLSLLIKNELPTSAELPRYSLAQLWDGINASDSFWTWDRAADKRFGLLMLHLDKQHVGTRWMHVFADADQSGKGAGVEEVPETLDPSELYNIREALEKYTAALQTGEDMSGLGLGTGVPSLADGERDEAVDSGVGRRFVVTWLGADGTKPAWARDENADSFLLSLPVPGMREEQPTLVVRSDIDGLLYSLIPTGNASGNPIEWRHAATYPALAFVLASKRDTRFRFHICSRMVIAFESGTSLGGGNIFIYHAAKSKEVWAKQNILKVSGGSAGALLGVGRITTASDEHVLLCLCERELVVVKNVS